MHPRFKCNGCKRDTEFLWLDELDTPKGRNAFFDLFERAKTDPDWFPFFLPASETGILPQSELVAASKEMTPEQYEQEFECSFEAAIIGAYYGKDMAESERAGRITDVPYDPALPVYTTWDLGIGDSTAIWFWQAYGSEIRVIDFYEASGESIEHYAKVLQAKPYKYDGRVQTLNCDLRRYIFSDFNVLWERVVDILQALMVSLDCRVFVVRIRFKHVYFKTRTFVNDFINLVF